MRFLRDLLVAFATLSLSAMAGAANSYTYQYTGPNFFGSSGHLVVSFTTATPLQASKSYLTATSAGVTSSAVSVVGASTVMTMPITTFQLHTNASGAVDAWFISGDVGALTGSSPRMAGTDQQAYTMNTLVFIPGSDIPGASGLVTGPYAYDQATKTTFYSSCTGAPSGCNLAGNGQPYVGNYSGIINPSNTSGAWWNATVNGQVPLSSCAGDKAVITSVGRDFLVVNGGLNLADHVWYAPQAATTFTGGTSTFVTGELITYSGTLDPVAGCYASSMTVMPKPAALAVSGTLPNGTVGTAYSASLAATGGLAPYTWSANGLPAGLSMSGGVISGTPTTAGIYSVSAQATDSLGATASASYSLSIAAAPVAATCTKPAGAIETKGRGKLTAIGNGYVYVGGTKVSYNSCSTIKTGYAKTLTVGKYVSWEGYAKDGANWAVKIEMK